MCYIILNWIDIYIFKIFKIQISLLKYFLEERKRFFNV